MPSKLNQSRGQYSEYILEICMWYPTIENLIFIISTSLQSNKKNFFILKRKKTIEKEKEKRDKNVLTTSFPLPRPPPPPTPVNKTSLLRRLLAHTLPNAAPPVGKIHLFSKIAIYICLLVELHREGPALAACAAGLFCILDQYLKP